MESYTLTLWEYLSQGHPLFDFPYDIWDESQRARIQQVLVDFYMYRQICVDNPEYFHHLFKSRWNLHWPYFNELYKSAEYKYNPLTTHYTEETTGEQSKTRGEDNAATIGVGSETGRQSTAGTTHDELSAKAASKTVGNETENTDRTQDFWEHVDTHNRGTLDSTVDRTSTETASTTQHTDTTSDGTLGKTVTGNSTRETESDSNTTTNNTETHSDFPQANIAAIAPENPGKWATWQKTGSGTSNTHSTGTETINNSETTEQTTNDQSVSDGNTHSETDATGKEVTDTDTTDSGVKDTHANTVEHIARQLDTTSKTNESEKQTQDGKSYTNTTSKNDSTTQQATARTSKQRSRSEKRRILSGYLDKSPQELLKLYRDSLINIDKQLIDTFATLFLEVF